MGDADACPGPVVTPLPDPPGMGMAAGMLPAQLGTAASAPIASPEIEVIMDLASFLTCSMRPSTSMPASSSAGRAASKASMAASAHATTLAIWACIAPSVVAQADRQVAASPTWAPTIPRLTKYFVHAAEMTSARSPCP